MPRTPISETPYFYQRDENVEVCDICSAHKFVIVQRFGTEYGMHTYTGNSVRAYCFHIWRTRQNDPTCLAGFVPTNRQAPHNVRAAGLRAHILERVQAPPVLRKRPPPINFPRLEDLRMDDIPMEANAEQLRINPVARRINFQFNQEQ